MSFCRFVFECKDLLRKGSRTARRAGMIYEQLSGSQKQAQDWETRCELVHFAYKNIPFYRNFYRQKGFHPDQLNKETDWGQVPVLEKTMIRTECSRFILPGVNRKYLVTATTGGSTGQPLKLYKDRRVHYEVLHWRALAWYGCHPADNIGIVNRRVPVTYLQWLKNRALWWPTRRCYLDASNVTKETMLRFLREINRLNVVYLTGYCGSLEHIADYALAHNISTPTLKMVWTTTSPLRSDVRKRMENAFGCPVMDQYGSCELPNIAVQKKGECTLTVNSDYVHVDLIDENAQLIEEPQVFGDILITDLKTTIFPLIKYRLGDRSAWADHFSTSPDGFPKLQPVQGRITDAIQFADGNFIDGAYLTTICDAYSDTVASYQIYQDRKYRLTLRIVLKAGRDSQHPDIKKIVDNLEKKIAKRAPLLVKFCDYIPDDRGKRRYIISEIALRKKQ